MSSSVRKIPFDVQIGRVVELLASQIYQSPLALLRENTQNAFDAILLRLSVGAAFSPRIEISVTTTSIQVTDNGVGMTADELEANYWRAGASGKNTPEARAAGVVGTFGIGGMANFGIAKALTVVTESSRTGDRTRSFVEREFLSTSRDCITLEPLPATGSPGTTVTADLEEQTRVSVDDAKRYIAQFVQFASVPISVNGDLVSGHDFLTELPTTRVVWSEKRSNVNLSQIALADIDVSADADGLVRCVLQSLETSPVIGPKGRAVLVQGASALRTMRSGFGLATVGVASQFRFGGVIDLAALQPTAGREALDDRSNELLRRLVAAVDEIAAEIAVHHPDSLDNIPVLSWIVRHGKYELAESLRVRTEPEGKQMRLADLRAMTQSVIWYGGTDSQVIRSYGSEEKPLIVISRQGPRRDCEIGYLRSISATEIADRPHVLERLDAGSLSTAHGAVLFRMARVLVEDYFVDSQVRFARMSHGIPVLVDRSETPPVVYLDPDSPSIAALATWYDSDFVTFGALVKDYVRSHVFPKLSDLVPSSTREGADAFLRRLRAKQELFEIDWTDRDDLASIWSQYALGEINLTEAAIRSRAVSLRSVVEIRPSQAGSISAVVPALEEPSTEAVEPGSDPYGPLPPIDRREISTEALVLTGEIPINGYRCFVALSERAQQQHAEFFYQPHTTSVVWGGQKIMFVFLHHSGRFGLYYDVQCPGLVAKASGGGTQQTSTILLSNHVFIPVPDEVADNFVPKQGERLRFEIRCDVLPVEIAQDDLQLADGKVSAA